MDIDRRRLLIGGAAGVLAGGAGASSPAGPALIVVYASGGWDTTYTFDPKLSSPYVQGPEVDAADPDQPDDVEEIATFAGIPVVVNPVKRPSVGAFFEAWAPRTVVVNGVWAGGIAHVPNRRRVLAGTADPSRPDAVAILGSKADLSLPFGAVDLSGLCAAGPFGSDIGRLGYHWQLADLVDPAAAGGDLATGLSDDPQGDALVAGYLRRRADAMRALDPTDPWLADLGRGQDRWDALRARRADLAALLSDGADLSRNLTANLNLAADLVVGDWCRAVMVDSQQYFDTHLENFAQHERNDELFAGLSGLLAALDAAGALDRTLVVVASEMTRTPMRNLGDGKDHWPSLGYLLLGGGVVGGRVLGATDDHFEPLAMDLATGEVDPGGEICRYDGVMAGIVRHLGLDADEWFPGVVPLTL